MKVIESSILLATGVIDPAFIHAKERDEATVPPITPPGPPIPPIPPPAVWTPLKKIGDTSFYGFNQSVGGNSYGPVSSGKTYFFLIDPKTEKFDGKPQIMAGDVSQAIGCGAQLWTLDASNNKVAEYKMRGGNNQMSINMWAATPLKNSTSPLYNIGDRLLLAITPVGYIQSMYIYWF